MPVSRRALLGGVGIMGLSTFAAACEQGGRAVTSATSGTQLVDPESSGASGESTREGDREVSSAPKSTDNQTPGVAHDQDEHDHDDTATDYAPDVVFRLRTDLSGPLGRDSSESVVLELEAVELDGILAEGAGYTYSTFNGKVPGPFLRIRVGDTAEIHLKNAGDNRMIHSVDFHAVTGPGGGATLSQVPPGEERVFTFKALKSGLFVYHCATPSVAHHISSGMYGMILLEPEGGLRPVDREFYVMQGELYTQEPIGSRDLLEVSHEKLLDEQPEYFVFNGAAGALTADHSMHAEVGETVRIFFGAGGPNFTSSLHLIGEIFDRVYNLASLTSPALTDVQTTVVLPGGATVVEFKLEVPGRYILVDHALARLERGLVGFLFADDDNPEIYKEGAT